MALTPTVLTDAYILLNAVVVSDHGNKVEIHATVEDKDITAFGQTWKVRTGGIKDGSISIDFIADYVAANLDATMWPLLGTVVTIEVRPTSAARSVSNPAYTTSFLVKEWKPISGAIGDLATVSVSYPTSGPVLRQTA